MKNFWKNIHKHGMWLYLTALLVFAYRQFMEQLPDHIYVEKGEQVELSCSLPVGFSVSYEDPVEVMANVGETTYETVLERTDAVITPDGVTADCRVTCYLFGVLPVKQIAVSVVSEQSVYASGRIIGIYEQTNGVLVLKTAEVTGADGLSIEPAKNRIMSGDYIIAVNGTSVRSKEELVDLMQENRGAEMVLSVYRHSELIEVRVTPVLCDDGAYRAGIWVKDDLAGIGTMSYYAADGSFGALGHGIGDGETGELLSVDRGSIYTASLQGIAKGRQGSPGELEGAIYYDTDSRLGTIDSNSEIGIYGTLETEDLLTFSQQDTLYPVGYKQEVTDGDAYILSDVSGEVKRYDIRITELHYQPENSNKGIRFTVTDPALLSRTGGIVQGMSGSPIIQNSRIIGAVTHVLVNDPARGYGIFLETMLENK